MESRYAVLCLIAGLLLLWLGGNPSGPVTILGDVLVFLGVVAFVVRIVKGPHPQFTRDQLLRMRALVNEDLARTEQHRQDLINKAASDGVTLSTEEILKPLEAAKATYQGPDREQFIAALDRVAKDYREKYDDQVPIDEAYKHMKEWE